MITFGFGRQIGSHWLVSKKCWPSWTNSNTCSAMRPWLPVARVSRRKPGRAHRTNSRVSPFVRTSYTRGRELRRSGVLLSSSSFSFFQGWLLIASVGVIAVTLVAALSGVDVARCLVILMLAPTVTVVGSEARAAETPLP
jgi:hypothetical protein